MPSPSPPDPGPCLSHRSLAQGSPLPGRPHGTLPGCVRCTALFPLNLWGCPGQHPPHRGNDPLTLLILPHPGVGLGQQSFVPSPKYLPVPGPECLAPVWAFPECLLKFWTHVLQTPCLPGREPERCRQELPSGGEACHHCPGDMLGMR